MITTKVEIENYLLTTIDASFDTQLGLWISAVSQYINTLANRYVIAEDTAQDYTYTGSGTSVLFIDDFNEIVSVKVSDVTLAPADYVAKPFNLPYKNQLRYQSNTAWSNYPEGNVVVNGKRGMFAPDAIPEDLRFASTVLVAGIIQSSSNENKDVQSETIGRYSVSYRTDTQKIDYKNAIEIIKSYRRSAI